MGIDAGVNIGWAILDFKGKIIEIGSMKGIGKGVMKKIEKFGTPLIVSTDVSKPPRLVKSIATKFGARLSLPKYDMSVEEKKVMTRGFKLKNKHERDALASAFRALKEIKDLERRVRKRGGDEEILKRLFKGEAKNIVEALNHWD